VKRSAFINVYIPLGVVALLLAVSIVADLTNSGDHWSQRFGAVMVVVGAYIMHFDDSMRSNAEGEAFYYSVKSAYTHYSLPCIIIGTLLWGYGDLVL